jgi:uncharacterized membrane protein HdeD (DUF308 family)
MRGKPKILLASNLLAGYSWPFIIAQAVGALIMGVCFLFFGDIILTLLGFAIGFLMIGSSIQQFRLWFMFQRSRKLWGGFVYALLLLSIGCVLILFPLFGVFQVLILVALWSIIHGLELLVAAFRQNQLRIPAGLNGILSILFGIIIFVYPNAGLQFINTLLACYLVFYGLITLFVGLKLRAAVSNTQNQ